MTETGPSSFFFRTGLLVVASLIAAAASAGCLVDLHGEVFCGAGRCNVDRQGKVWCSRHYDGDAAITLNGKVLCGKGRCGADSHGRVFCSSEVGGAVQLDRRGRVRCYGRCEPASADQCESTLADSAGGLEMNSADR